MSFPFRNPYTLPHWSPDRRADTSTYSLFKSEGGFVCIDEVSDHDDK